MKHAVIGDGTAAHEHFVVTVTADSPEDALEKVAQLLIDNPDDAASERTEVDNFSSPTYYCDVLNENGDTIYNLKTAPLTEI